MWRATVIHRSSPGRVTVVAPALYGNDSPIQNVQSAVDAHPGERVILVDLNPRSKAHDWWIVSYESQIGRGFGSPSAAHEHPMGQIVGLLDELAAKANKSDIPEGQDLSQYATKNDLTSGLSTKANASALSGYATTSALTQALSGKADLAALNSYATTTALTQGLSGKLDSTTYNNGMLAKADAPGSWIPCTVGSYITPDTTTSPALTVRNTPLGVQIRGRYRTVSAVPMDAVVFTLPAAFPVTHPILIGVPTMGPGSAYAALTYQFEIQTNRTVTARQDFVSGARMTFNQILTF